MTEREWLVCMKRPDMMWAHVRGSVSERKQRLFAVACARHFWPSFVDDRSRAAVLASEEYADGRLTRAELLVKHQAAYYPASQDAWFAFAASASEAESAACSVALQGFHLAARRVQRYTTSWHSLKRLACDLFREICGNPFRPVAIDPTWLAWQGGTIPKLAQGIYDDRAFDQLPVLADALEEAGCADAEVLGHLRGPGPHARGCWSVDLLLGKE
ncbi:MAG TPA: hypothetical protein VEL76_04515 [Gemmataceae bacterium]|nr:hypothetical protein [Gemmataceae bacterium]